MRIIPLFAVAALLWGCDGPGGPPVLAKTDDIDAFAAQVLNDLQPQSIAEGREYCGYIYVTDTGGLAATAARPGGEGHCDLPAPGDTVLASYHTHGSYSADYDNEVPSSDDLMSDFESGTDGYISTPAGRIWHVDFETRRASQLCSTACVIADPNDDPSDTGLIAPSYTLEDLLIREDG